MLGRQLRPALLVGLLTAAMLLLYGAVAGAWFEGTPAATFSLPLATRLAYGGIGEELLMRWGLMTLLVWLLLKLGLGRSAYLLAATAAALLFAAGTCRSSPCWYPR